MAGVKVQVSGGKAWKKTLTPYIDNADTVAKVGILEGAKYAQGPNAGELVAPIAAIHEFGTANIPARSFIRSTMAKKKAEWIKFLTAYLKANPGKVVQGFTAVGEQAAKEMMQAIEDGIAPPLAYETILRKAMRKGREANNALPLVDTGTMEEAIACQVNDLPPVYPGKKGGA